MIGLYYVTVNGYSKSFWIKWNIPLWRWHNYCFIHTVWHFVFTLMTLVIHYIIYTPMNNSVVRHGDGRNNDSIVSYVVYEHGIFQSSDSVSECQNIGWCQSLKSSKALYETWNRWNKKFINKLILCKCI